MKNIDTTAKFAFKKTTVTVFNSQAACQAKGASETADSTLVCSTLQTSVWTSSILGTLDTIFG